MSLKGSRNFSLADPTSTVSKATCIWKFFPRHFIASMLDAGCGGYLDKIYKILVDVLDLKAGFPLANFFIQSDFFCSKTMKSRIGFYFFLLWKKSLTNENSAKIGFVQKNSQVENRLNQPSRREQSSVFISSS